MQSKAVASFPRDEQGRFTGQDGQRHGTMGMYVNELCRCDECREANAAYSRDRRDFIREFGELVPGWRDHLRKRNEEAG